MPQHVVVDLRNNTVAVLAVDVADVGGVDFVLVLDGGDEAGDGGRDQVQGSVHILSFLTQEN